MTMKEIKCPKCGEVFTVDESGYASIVQQVRDQEFKKEVEAAIAQKVEAESLKIKSTDTEEINRLKLQVTELNNKLLLQDKDKELAVSEATTELKDEISKLQLKVESINKDKIQTERVLNEQIEFYKNLKAKQSTKMVGETLEQHCDIEFNKIRATAFPRAYFEKDNDARTGSKGDFIFKDFSPEGTEYLSIMFEMKNENDETATKHKNEDFFKELDKDRNEKGCEYAVLVSMLEPDNDLYNVGIVDVSYRYPKMYVIRPQFFIPLITILKNANEKTISYKNELVKVQNQNIDYTNFEENLRKYQDDFARNVELARNKFQLTIDEIDKAISHLQKTREALVSSDNNLRIANEKVADVSIKKLTKNSPSIKEKLEGK